MPFLLNLGTLSAQAVVLTVFTLVVTHLLREKLTPRARCWIWGLVVLRLCLPVSLETPFSVFNLFRPSTLRTKELVPLIPEVSTQPMATGVPTPAATRRTDSLPAAPRVVPPAAPVPGSAAPAMLPQRTLLPLPSLPHLALGLWGLGALLLLGRTGWFALLMHRTVAAAKPESSAALIAALDQARHVTGVRTPIGIRSIPGLDSPALYGAVRPLLLVPPDLEQRLRPDQLRHVLLHECAHVRRHDIALNWVMSVLQAIHWFNPAVWFAFSRLRVERELACDEIALEIAGQDDCEAYGQTLLQLIASQPRDAASFTPGAIGLFERHGDLRRRLRHIAEFRPGRRLGLPLAAVIAVSGALTLTDAQSPATTNGAAVPATATQLPPVVPLRYTNSLVAPENRDLFAGGNWAKAPRGSNVLGGVHFEVDGLLQFASKNSVAANRGFRDFVNLSIRTNRYGSVHLLAATAWSSEANRRVADVIWRYADGTYRRSPILYGAHVRDFLRRPFEVPHTVSSPLSKCAVSWTSPDAERNKAALRCYRVTLPNPEPSKTVAFLQIQSAMEDASLLVLAVSLDPLEAGKRPDPSPDAEAKDPEWTRHLVVNLIDAGTSNGVPGAAVTAIVSTATFSVSRPYVANGSGVADVLLPQETVSAVTLEASATNYVTTRLRLAPSPTNALPDSVTIRLQGGLRIGGRVVSTSGEPVAGATVEAVSFLSGRDPFGRDPWQDTQSKESVEFGRKELRTDENGRWEMGSLPKALLQRIQINVTHEDFAPSNVESVAANASVQAALLEGRHEFRLVPAAVVTGIVLGSEGEPVPNATVRVGRLHFQMTTEGQTDASGRFRIGGLTPGATVITARSKERGGVSQELTISPKTPEVTLRLAKGRPFSGIVMDADQRPLAEVRVVAEPGPPGVTTDLNREWIEFSTSTGADGSWTWNGGPDAEVRFSFLKDGYSRSKATVRPGEPATTVLNKPRVVQGVVLDAETGDPVTQFRVEPRSHSFWNPFAGRDVTSSEGRFTLEIDEDEYDQLSISSPIHEPLDERMPDAVDGVVQMTVRLKKSGDWSGVVVDASGRPVASAFVGITGEQNHVVLKAHSLESVAPSSMAVTREGGDFKLSAIRKPWAVVAASEEGFGLTPTAEFQKSHRIRLLPYGTLQGTYRGDVDENGTTSLALMLFAGGNNPWLGIISGPPIKVTANGTFRIEQVPPGNHKLQRMVLNDGSFQVVPFQDVLVEPGQTTMVEFEKGP